jgi:DNA-binding CsgD family transcriptional regulator
LTLDVVLIVNQRHLLFVLEPYVEPPAANGRFGPSLNGRLTAATTPSVRPPPSTRFTWWYEAMCRWRWAQALLSEGASRSAIAQPLRQAHTLAMAMGAAPLVAETESLALAARINLVEPGPLMESSGQHPVLATLTTREREVLSHLVAGRTNAEIARDLFISDKTVSVHVTNVLRKTGTPNRVEAASLALRLGLN